MTGERMIVTCDACNGDGGGESAPHQVYGTHWIECAYCGGTGEIEIDVELIDEDEADELRCGHA